MSETNLWGDLSTLKKIRTPKTLLLEQAEILSQAPGGVVRGQVDTTQNGDILYNKLTIVAPALDNYSYAVCVVRHDVELYPCSIYDQRTTQWTKCENEADLKEKLGAILSGEKTRRVIEALLSQSE
jgi:hypothetical protein